MKTTIHTTSTKELAKAAAFIAEMNQSPQNHIGYCGTKEEEIRTYLQQDLTDLAFEDAFVLAYHQDKLIGILGMDADFENNSAEVWGPFVKGEDEGRRIKVLDTLWERLLERVPQDVEKLCMFPNKSNKLALDLAKKQAFTFKSEQAILHLERRIGKGDVSDPLIELSSAFYEEMRQLHDKNFPGTYYNGQQILDRMNADRRVFIKVMDNKLAGYIYVEVDPVFGEANIEFFAVNEAFRGKGIGASLLKDAISWIFTYECIPAIQLCVDASNQHALRLYQKVGFILKNELVFLTRTKAQGARSETYKLD